MATQFVLCLNRQGKVRLSKWYMDKSISEQRIIIKRVHEIIQLINKNNRNIKFVEFNNNFKLIFKKYHGLFFVICIENFDNELLYLPIIPLFVKILDVYFDTVSELDLIFNFYIMYRILDQIIINGKLIINDEITILNNLSNLKD
jgi:AP-2 complex subunit sigma-1